ncbi:MAG: hypothetical protein P9M15_07910 [Candidatus Electryoneaceae bacterium]|nr:hypothetical protein [Candidatus Electryoneaceae bacterium]
MEGQTTIKDYSSFSLDKGLVDPLAEHQQRIEDYLDLLNKKTSVRFLNKKRKSKFWKVLTTNII